MLGSNSAFFTEVEGGQASIAPAHAGGKYGAGGRGLPPVFSPLAFQEETEFLCWCPEKSTVEFLLQKIFEC